MLCVAKVAQKETDPVRPKMGLFRNHHRPRMGKEDTPKDKALSGGCVYYTPPCACGQAKEASVRPSPIAHWRNIIMTKFNTMEAQLTAALESGILTPAPVAFAEPAKLAVGKSDVAVSFNANEKVDRQVRRAIERQMRHYVYASRTERKDVANYVFSKVVINKDGSVDCTVSRMPNNVLVRKELVETVETGKFTIASFDEEGRRVGPKGVLSIDNVGRNMPTDNLLSLVLDSLPLADRILNGRGVLAHKLVAGRPVFLYRDFDFETEKEVWFDVIGNKVWTGENPKLNATWKMYAFLVATPAGMRTNSSLWINILRDKDGKIAPDYEYPMNVMNEVAYGSLAIAQEKSQKEGLVMAKLVKTEARPGQRTTYTINAGEMPCVFVYHGTLCGDGCDGLAFGDESFVRQLMNQDGYDIKSLAGESFRARPGSAKAMLNLLNKKTFAQKIAQLERLGGSFTKIGEGEPVALFDDNCWKAVIASDSKLELDILAPMVELSQPTWNIQLITKALMAGTYPVNALKAGIDKMFDKAFANGKLSISALQAGTNSMALNMLSSEISSYLGGIKKAAVETAAKSLFKKVQRLNVPIDQSKWLYIVGDFASGLQSVLSSAPVKLLNEFEVYTPGMPKGDVACTRFPSVFYAEHYTGRNIGDEIFARIEALAVCSEDKEMLHDMVANLSPVHIMAPDSDLFRMLTGGSDTDTDTLIASQDPLMLSIFKRIDPVAIFADAEKSNDMTEYVYDYKNRNRVLYENFKAAKIGVECNHVTAWVDLFLSSHEVKTKVLSDLFQGGGKFKYAKRFVNNSHISNDTVKATIKTMNTADFSVVEVCDAVILDMIAIQKTIVDRVIDAVKTGDRAKAPIGISKAYHGYALSKTGVFQNANGKWEIRDAAPGTDEWVGGKLSELIYDLTDYTVNKVNGIEIESKMPERLKGMISKCICAAGSKPIKGFVDVYGLNKVYRDISGMKRFEKAICGGNNELESQAVSWAKECYAAITNMGVMVKEAAGHSDTNLGKIAVAVSGTTFDYVNRRYEVSESIESNFGTVCFGKHIAQWAAQSETVGAVREEIALLNGFVPAEEPVHFANGVVKADGQLQAISLGGKISGDFNVVEEDGVFYAEGTVAEILKPAEKDGRVIFSIHNSYLKDTPVNKARDQKALKAFRASGLSIEEYIGQADKIVVSTPNMAGSEDQLVLFKGGEEYGRVRICTEGAYLCQAMNKQELSLTLVHAGQVEGAQNDLHKACVVLGRLVGHTGDLLADEAEESMLNMVEDFEGGLPL